MQIFNFQKVMAEKIRYAMYNCVEMDADFRLSEIEMSGWEILDSFESWRDWSGSTPYIILYYIIIV